MSNVSNVFKRAQRGLYGGKSIGFGNWISFSHRKSRRSWKPNVQTKKLTSDLLGTTMPIKVTTHALRTIDKKGGLDNYLLYSKPEQIASRFGMELRSKVIQAWEKKENRKFNRSMETFKRRLATFSE